MADTTALEREVKELKDLLKAEATHQTKSAEQLAVLTALYTTSASELQAAKAAAAAAGSSYADLAVRVGKLELSSPAKLSPKTFTHIFKAIFVIIDIDESASVRRKVKVSRQALEATASGSSTQPVPGGHGFMYMQSDLAVTAYHQLQQEELEDGRPLRVYLPSTKQYKTLKFISGDCKLYVAYLKCIDADADQPYLEPDDTIDPGDCLATPVVLYTTNIHMATQMNNEPIIGQRLASITTAFDYGFFYNASTYSGDCGCPVLSRNGKVIGMHVAMNNEYKPGQEASVSFASSGPHDAEAVFACRFPQVPTL